MPTAVISWDAEPQLWHTSPSLSNMRCVTSQTITSKTGNMYANSLHNCDGSREGINRHRPAHTICFRCTNHAYNQYDVTQWNDARILPLCYSCSSVYQNSEHWTPCYCEYSHRPIPPAHLKANTNLFCSHCRRTYYDGLLNTAISRWRLGLRKRLDKTWAAVLHGPEEQLRMYVNDWHWTQRNYGICGLDWEAINESYPKRWVTNTQGVSRWSTITGICSECVWSARNMCALSRRGRRIGVRSVSRTLESRDL